MYSNNDLDGIIWLISKYTESRIILPFHKIWHSIINPVKINDFITLSDNKLFDNYINELKDRIDFNLIKLERKDNIYFQKKTTLVKDMGKFHNWIKSALIYNYCSKDLTGNKLTALDIGIGRGGDIMKYYSAKIGELVGIDVDSNGIFSATDGAYSRYNNFKRKFPGFAKMTFLVADGGAKLNLEDQIKTIGSMDDKNKQLLKEIFGEKDTDKSMKFDIISSQFVLHYMFKDDVTFDNLCKNINKLLKPGGYLFFTTMDGDLVHEELKKNNGKIESFYSNKEGTKNKFFHVIGKYDINDSIDKTGLAVDFYNSSFQEEGNSMIEYLITNKFVVESFKEKCGLELVETENFQNIYNSFKSFFTNTAKYEENIKTRAYFEGIAKFYDLNDEVNKASFELSRLNRLYVFQKRLLVDESKKLAKKVMKRNSKK